MTRDEREPFQYLNQVDFLAMSTEERIAYLQKVNEHLARRLALLEEKAAPKN